MRLSSFILAFLRTWYEWIVYSCPKILSSILAATMLFANSAYAIRTIDYPTFEIIGAQIDRLVCNRSDSGQLVVAEKSGPVTYVVPEELCWKFDQEFAKVFKCQSVRADLLVEDETYAYGYLGSKVITRITNLETSECL